MYVLVPVLQAASGVPLRGQCVFAKGCAASFLARVHTSDIAVDAFLGAEAQHDDGPPRKKEKSAKIAPAAEPTAEPPAVLPTSSTAQSSTASQSMTSKDDGGTGKGWCEVEVGSDWPEDEQQAVAMARARPRLYIVCRGGGEGEGGREKRRVGSAACRWA